MKKLLKQDRAPSEVTTTDEPDKKKSGFTCNDLVDILQQIEELNDYNIAIKNEDGVLLLAVGDSVYEISKIRENRYPRRALRKLET